MNLMINYHDHWWYKALTWLLIVAIIIMISIGAAPPARAIGVLTATMAAAILAVLTGAGIYTVVSGMTSAQIQDWLNDKLNEWDTSRNDGNVFSDLIQNNLIAATVRGTLAIGNEAASGISEFITWLKNNLSLVDNYSVDVLNTSSTLGSIVGYYGNTFTFYNWNNTIPYTFTSNIDVLWAAFRYNSGAVDYYAISPQQFIMPNGFFRDNEESSYLNGYYYCASGTQSYTTNTIPAIEYNANPPSGYTVLSNMASDIPISSGGTIIINTDVIGIPDVNNGEVIDLQVGAYPGASTEDVTDVIIDGVLDNTLNVDMVVTDELVDAQEVYIINEQPLSVNTDHHAFGFQLPEIAFDFSSIWHYVTDAVTYASGFISWWVSFFTSVPILTIPLYCAFTLLVVLGAMRRFLL